jgi:hypothetical protein
MVQLIKMKPAIELIDLYISDNIAAIFKGVKQNYLHQQKYVREHDILGNEKRDTAAVFTPAAQSKKWIWWTLGGVGTAAIATTLYFAVSDKPATDLSSDIKP